jgi:hypothetical protein
MFVNLRDATTDEFGLEEFIEAGPQPNTHKLK